MVNSFMDAVTKQLGTTFGDSYKYYKETIEQNFEKPCFHVAYRVPTIRSKSPVLYDRTMPIIIHYFSDSDTHKNNDCYTVAERLLGCLEYLPFNNTLIRGEDISSQIIENNVLQVFITYKFTTKRIVEEDPMLETVETVTQTN